MIDRLQDVLALADEILGEGLSASGLSGETDGGAPGPGGGSPNGEEDENQTKPPVGEADVLAYSGSGPTTFVDGNATLPWARGRAKRRRKVHEAVEPDSLWYNHDTGILHDCEGLHHIEWAQNHWDKLFTEPGPYRDSALKDLMRAKSPSDVARSTLESNTRILRDRHDKTITMEHGDKSPYFLRQAQDALMKMKAPSDWKVDHGFHNSSHFIRTTVKGTFEASNFHGLGESLTEDTGFMLGRPTDATLTGKIQITILDNVNIRIIAPSRILESVEAYKFFEQFQILLPRTPMLNANLMESISSWWRNFAVPGDILEIDCTSGFSTVTNAANGNYYGLGCLGNAPDYPGIAG